MTARQLHLMTERLTSLFRTKLRQTASDHGLKLVQLEALIYLSTANRYSDTPIALSEYLGMTKGTVSQTLKVLERRELIAKTGDPIDGRVQHCHPTTEGDAIVRQAYPSELFTTLGPEGAALADSLGALLRALQQQNGLKTFGLCHTCRHYQKRGKQGRCGLTQERLNASDAERVCREHAPTDAG